MVVFTCQKCNSTLKKNSVEKHNCRPFFLTCIDCLKDFRGKEYEDHKSCITEAQKYGGPKVVVKPQGNKQEKWIDIASETLSKIAHISKFKKICDLMKTSSNIPRQRSKFHNYLKSLSPKLYNVGIVDEIFNHLEEAKKSKSETKKEELSIPNGTALIKENNNVGIEKNVVDVETLENKKKRKKKEKYMNCNEQQGGAEVDTSRMDISEQLGSIGNNDIGIEKHVNGFGTLENKDKSENCTKFRGQRNVKYEAKKHGAAIDTKNKMKQRYKEKMLRNKIKQGMSVEQKYDLSCWFNITRNDISDQRNKENEEECQVLSGQEVSNNNETQLPKTISPPAGDGFDNKLSKKERKKIKKQQKYFAEIDEMKNDIVEKESMDETIEERSKRKNENKMELESRKITKLSPKHKLEEEPDAINAGKRIKLNDTLLPEEAIQCEPKKKFKWGNVILEILQGHPSNEMPLKKVRKKVLNAYRMQRGDDVPNDKLLGIFNKKVNKTVGVKVLKDKVVLLTS